MSSPSPTLHWRNRVCEFRLVSAQDLEDHPLQWRVHPDGQQSVLRGLLQEVGIAGALLAYVSPSTGRLTAIDGHLRKSMGPGPWPTLILDVTDDEAALLLASHDPLAALATSDMAQLDRLLRTTISNDPVIHQFLSTLAEDHGLYPDAPPDLDTLEETYGEPNPESFWPVISLKVPPEVYDAYRAALAAQPGTDDVARFAALVAHATSASLDLQPEAPFPLRCA